MSAFIPGEHDDYTPGYVRPGYAPVWGWKEFVDASGRTDAAVRYLRTVRENFPRPLYVLASGPMFLRSECEAFLHDNPVTARKALAPALVQEMYRRLDGGDSVAQVARDLDVTETTIYRYKDKRTARAGGAGRP